MTTPSEEFKPRAESTWLAALRGDESVLRQLSATLSTDALRLYTLSNEWVAYAGPLQHHASSIGFRDQARSDLLPLLNTLGRHFEPNFDGFQVANVIQVAPDGRQNRIIHVQFGAVEARGLPATINGEGGADRLVRLAWRHPEVLRIIRFRESPDRELWTGLYRVLEGIAEDVGGESCIANIGWESGNWIKVFRHTANTEAAGATSRHGHVRWSPPDDPMSIDEARRGIRGIFERWVDWKLSRL